MTDFNKDKIIKEFLTKNPKVSRATLQKVFPWFRQYLRVSHKDSINQWYKATNTKSRYKTHSDHTWITDKGLKILKFLLQQGIATTPQIRTYLKDSCSDDAMYRYLKKMERFGFVQGKTREHKVFQLWHVSVEGKKKLLNHVDDQVEYRRLASIEAGKITTSYIDHDLLLNDVRIVF